MLQPPLSRLLRVKKELNQYNDTAFVHKRVSKLNLNMSRLDSLNLPKYKKRIHLLKGVIQAKWLQASLLLLTTTR